MLYCVVTADAGEIGEGDLDNFLTSVRSQPAETIQVVAVLRATPTDVGARICADYPFVHTLHVSSMGLSRARNAGLRLLAQIGPAAADYVSFPDDDCTYPLGLADTLSGVIARTSADLVVGSYGPEPVAADLMGPLSVEVALLAASSVTVFVRWDVLCRTGGFNPGLGVGSQNIPYGEDNDFAVRALRKATVAVHAAQVRVVHPIVRPTSGRNPKGYMTACVLNPYSGAAWRLLLRGALGAVVQDTRAKDWRCPNMQAAVRALSIVKIARCLVERRRTGVSPLITSTENRAASAV